MVRMERTETAFISFKLAHTGATVIFEVPTNLSIASFIEFAKENAYERFPISRNQEIEIVEAGQNIPGIRDEDAPVLARDFNTTLREKYNGAYNNVSFYIRFYAM